LELPISGAWREPLIVRTLLLDPSGAEIDSHKETMEPGQRKLVEVLVVSESITEAEMPWLRARYSLELHGREIDKGIISVGARDKSLYQLRLSHPRALTPGQRFTARIRAFNPVTRAAVADVRLTASLELDDDSGLKHRLVTNGNGEAEVGFNVPKKEIISARLRVSGEPAPSRFNTADDDAWDPEVTAAITVVKAPPSR
jgi:hypothetical protein